MTLCLFFLITPPSPLFCFLRTVPSSEAKQAHVLWALVKRPSCEASHIQSTQQPLPCTQSSTCILLFSCVSTFDFFFPSLFRLPFWALKLHVRFGRCCSVWWEKRLWALCAGSCHMDLLDKVFIIRNNFQEGFISILAIFDLCYYDILMRWL